MSNLRTSLRERTSWDSLKKVGPNIKSHSWAGGGTQEEREARHLSILGHRRAKIRNIRQEQQAEKGLVEWPYGLFSKDNPKQIKKAYMTERESRYRNRNIASLGMYWTRIGY